MLKCKKGISLTTMVMTVMILLVIMGTLVYSALDSVKIRKLNKLYGDLRQLNDAVEIYYLKNGKLPIDSTNITISINETKSSISGKKIGFVLNDFEKKADSFTVSGIDDFCNPNDFSNSTANYYNLNLGLMENISLNYPDNTYIVNENSHTVYNLNGVKIDGTLYHALPLKYIDAKQDRLVLHYEAKNNTGEGTCKSGAIIWKDLSGHGNDGELCNFATTTCWSSNGLVFDGSDDGVYLDDKLKDLFKNNCTIEMYLKCTNSSTSNDTRDVLFGNYISGSIKYFNLEKYHSPNNSFRLCVLGSGSVVDKKSEASFFDNTNKIHYAMIFDKSSKKVILYKNGAKKTEFSDDIYGNYNFDFINAWIGRDGRATTGSVYFKGTMYSIKIYDELLTESEIQKDYNLMKTGY